MREIKFRAWDKKLKEMVGVGFHVIGEYTMFDIIEQHCYETKEDGTTLERLTDIEITQYVGRKDKNEVDIYEGDIIQVESHGIKLSKFRVYWCEYSLAFKKIRDDGETFALDSYQMSLTVIGNIYENPELLENSWLKM